MKIPFLQVDAFADRPFTGNPAAVMPLDRWLDDATLQRIAAENNLSETAFLVRRREWRLRTMSCAGSRPPPRSRCAGTRRWRAAIPCSAPSPAAAASPSARARPAFWRWRAMAMATSWRFRRGSPIPSHCQTSSPRSASIRRSRRCGIRRATGWSWSRTRPSCAGSIPISASWPPRATCSPSSARADATPTSSAAPSRPASGIDEDPVTGSAHAVMVPYWAEKLGRNEFSAFQASARGGRLGCRLDGERVILSGRCVTVIEGCFLLYDGSGRGERVLGRARSPRSSRRRARGRRRRAPPPGPAPRHIRARRNETEPPSKRAGTGLAIERTLAVTRPRIVATQPVDLGQPRGADAERAARADDHAIRRRIELHDIERLGRCRRSPARGAGRR